MDGEELASAKAQSADEPARKAHISGRVESISISDVVTASVNSEKTRMKKCMMIMIIIFTSNRKTIY